MTVDSTSIWAYQTLSRLPGAEETGVMTKVYETADRRVDLADRYRAALFGGSALMPHEHLGPRRWRLPPIRAARFNAAGELIS